MKTQTREEEELSTSPEAGILIDSQIIRGRLFSAKGKLLQEGLIAQEVAEKFDEVIKKAELGIDIRIPKRILSARLVEVEDLVNFTWTNKLFEALLALRRPTFCKKLDKNFLLL